MSSSEIDLGRIGTVLNSHGVDYVVVGGMAVVLQGGDATTTDVDLAFDRSQQNVERLSSALAELSAKPKRWITDGFRLQVSDLATKRLHLESDSGDIDLIAEIPAMPFANLKDSCDHFEIEGTEVPVASVLELIAMKRSTGRGKDSIHVAELEDILRLRGELDVIHE